MLQVDGIQSLGGTGALRIGMDLLRNVLGYETMYVSKPTWGKWRYFGEANVSSVSVKTSELCTKLIEQ